MTPPRHIAPAKTYLITRRTTRRHFIFRPDADGAMQNIFWFCLAVTAREFGMLVHAVTLMSTHLHVVITDVRGVLPDFLREFHRLLANATKRHRSWEEEVFSADSTSVVELLDAGAVIAECGYTIANPVTAGAVRRACDWPGPIVSARDIGVRVLVATRPRGYFRAGNPRWPARVELPIHIPRQVVDALGSEDAAREAIARSAREREERAWEEARRRGAGFGDARRATAIPVDARASTREQGGARAPTFAAGGDRRLARAAAAALRRFRAAYRDALELWRRGLYRVLFPAGTWLMRVAHGVSCEPGSGGLCGAPAT